MESDQSAESILFGAVADSTRRAIVDLLRREELSVQAIADQFEISRPAISRHLKILRQAGVISEVRRGRLRIYSLESDAFDLALDWLSSGGESPQPTKLDSSTTIGRRVASGADMVKDSTERNWKSW